MHVWCIKKLSEEKYLRNQWIIERCFRVWNMYGNVASFFYINISRKRFVISYFPTAESHLLSVYSFVSFLLTISVFAPFLSPNSTKIPSPFILDSISKTLSMGRLEFVQISIRITASSVLLVYDKRIARGLELCRRI